jgi:hypothetical protein
VPMCFMSAISPDICAHRPTSVPRSYNISATEPRSSAARVLGTPLHAPPVGKAHYDALHLLPMHGCKLLPLAMLTLH